MNGYRNRRKWPLENERDRINRAVYYISNHGTLPDDRLTNSDLKVICNRLNCEPIEQGMPEIL